MSDIMIFMLVCVMMKGGINKRENTDSGLSEVSDRVMIIIDE